MSTQAQCPIAWDDLERAALQGINLEKVTLAYIEMQRAGKELSFEDAVAAGRRDRLNEMLDET